MAETTEREKRRRASQSAASKNYDADKVAKELQEAEHTIDGKKFHRVLTNNRVSREVQDAGQEQAKHARLAQSKRLEIDALGRDPDDYFEDEKGNRIYNLKPLTSEELAKADTLEAEALAAEQEGEAITYRLVTIMLRDEEGNPPDEEMLREKVAIQSLRELARFGGVSVESGPTETAATSD